MIRSIIVGVAAFFETTAAMLRRWERKDAEQAGALKQREADLKENVRQGRKAHDIDNEVARLDDAALDKRLRKRARSKRH